MISMKPDKNINVKTIYIQNQKHKIPCLVLSPKDLEHTTTGILWIHGGGYIVGNKEMVHMSRAVNLVKKYHCVVLSPEYSLAWLHPYPSALLDLHAVLQYMYDHCNDFSIDSKQIMVGGESAGGGLCVSLCLYERDKHGVPLAFQMPLYPMLSYYDTNSSKNNHGKIWNTKRNHFAWLVYTRNGKYLDKYASPSLEKDYSDLPPCYTFVGNKEPFYQETVDYVEHLKEAGIESKFDIYDSNIHAFDMLYPHLDISKIAIQEFENAFAYAQTHYFSN